jgi:hypothetical protein
LLDCYCHVKEDAARDPLIVDPDTGRKVCMHHCGYVAPQEGEGEAGSEHDVLRCPYRNAVRLEARVRDELARLKRVAAKVGMLPIGISV